MRAPLSWLCDFAPFAHPVDTLADALSNLGLVVEGIARVGGGLDGVVVAEILGIRAHPDADRIRLVDVDLGTGQPLQIACGAHNFAVGDLVPLATIGAVLPGGFSIARRKMRGEWSNGMLCAASELDLPEPGVPDGLLILAPGLAPPGTPITDALHLVADVVFDVEVSPNRPDALSMAGVSRDLAAGLGLPWSPPTDVPWAPALTSARTATERTERSATVVVEAPDLCPRFTATVIGDVSVAASPPELARRLTLAGMRPINSVVDISNYVMLELGQPNHAYDLDRLGGGGLRVRRGRRDEEIVTLDGAKRTVGEDDCLICDAESVPVGIGGIMGGASSEISADTSTILLEAAWFAPAAIARTGNRLGLHSEARARFQHGVDPEIAGAAIDRFVTLLGASAPVRPSRGATVDVRDASLPQAVTVIVRTERVNHILGTDLTTADIAGLLAPIGFSATAGPEGAQLVAIPTWRPDSDREVDVIEEVARLHGYANIARTMPVAPRVGAGLTAYQRERRRVRDVLAGTGLSEAWTTTFLAPGDLARAGLPTASVEVDNPLDSNESVLRTALLPGLLKAVRFNLDRQQGDVRLFEIGRSFTPAATGSPLPDETEDLAVIQAGAGVDARWAVRTWAVLASALRLADVDVVAATAAGLHPTRAAHIVGRSPDGGRSPFGVVGEVDADVAAAFGVTGRVAYLSVDFGRLAAQDRLPGQARPISRFPASDVDLALVVDDAVPASAVAATLRGTGGGLLEGLALFDVYRDPHLGDGKRSLAFRLRFRAGDRTLSEAELGDLRLAHIEAVADAHGATLRQ